MILKYGDKGNGWSWLSGIQEISEVKNSTFYDVAIGEKEDASYYKIVFSDGDEVIYALGVKQAYLCNEQSGSTIDVLRNN